MAFQVLGKQETDFDLKGFYRFKDLETGKEVELQAESIKAEVIKNAQTYLKNLETALQIPFVYLLRANLGEPIANIISESLKKRKG